MNPKGSRPSPSCKFAEPWVAWEAGPVEQAALGWGLRQVVAERATVVVWIQLPGARSGQ